MTVTYYKISQDVLRKDYESLEKRHKKLEALHSSLGERVSVAEKEEKIAENKIRLLTGQLTLAQKKVTILEKKEKIVIPPSKELMTIENKLRKVETELKAAEFIISADTDELRDRLEKEHKNRKEKFKKEINDLYATITENNKLFKILNKKYDDTTANWVQERNKLVEKITEITTLENKTNTIIGKVISAKNKITSLNSNTPYRPGAVERTLSDVMEDLRNV